MIHHGGMTVPRAIGGQSGHAIMHAWMRLHARDAVEQPGLRSQHPDKPAGPNPDCHALDSLVPTLSLWPQSPTGRSYGPCTKILLS